MKKQVNVQIDEEDRVVLEALAFLRGELLADVARGALLDLVARYRDSPRVQRVLSERADEQKEQKDTASSVASLDRARDARRSRN